MKRTFLLAALALPLAALAAPAAEPVSPASAQKVAVDPKTGALRPPTSEEAKSLAVPAPASKPEVVTLPDGSKMIRLKGNHLSWSVARRNADGSVTLGCARSPETPATKDEVRR